MSWDGVGGVWVLFWIGGMGVLVVCWVFWGWGFC